MDADPVPHVTKSRRVATHWPRAVGWATLAALWPAILTISSRLPARDAFTVDNLDEMGRTATVILVFFLLVVPVAARAFEALIVQVCEEAREISDASAARIAAAVADEVRGRETRRPAGDGRWLRVAQKDQGGQPPEA